MTPAVFGSANMLDRVIVEEEILPSGKKIWVARDMDLDGCIAQSDISDAEARVALHDARRDYTAVVQEQRLVPSGELKFIRRMTPVVGTMTITQAMSFAIA